MRIFHGNRRVTTVVLTLLIASMLVATMATSASAYSCSNWRTFDVRHGDGVARATGRYSRTCSSPSGTHVEVTVHDILNDNRAARVVVRFAGAQRSGNINATGGVGSTGSGHAWTGRTSGSVEMCMKAYNSNPFTGDSREDCPDV